jgi:hypothetical protein
MVFMGYHRRRRVSVVVVVVVVQQFLFRGGEEVPHGCPWKIEMIYVAL